MLRRHATPSSWSPSDSLTDFLGAESEGTRLGPRTRTFSPLRERFSLVLLPTAILVPVLPHLHVPWGITLVLAILVSSWLPGSNAVRYLHLDQHVTRDALAFAISATVTITMAMLLATLGVRYVVVAWYLVMVVPYLALMSREFLRGGLGQLSVRTEGILGQPARRRPAPTSVKGSYGWTWLLVATALWILGLALSGASSLGQYGLTPVMSPIWWLGGVVLIGWMTTRALLRPRTDDWPFRLGLVSVTLFLHLPGIVLEQAPRLPWLYKHLGVVDYITMHHAVDPRIDVYHNWPGFFAYASWMNQITGADSLHYAAYTPIVVNLAAAFLASALYVEFGIGVGARHMGLILLLIGNWIGQDYFAPQAMAYLLYMSLLLFCVVAYGHRPLKRWVKLPRWLAPVPIATGKAMGSELIGQRRWTLLAAIYLGLLMLTATHQLTPLFMLATLALGAFVGIWRTWRVTFIAGFVLVGYLAMRYPFLANKYNVSVSFDPMSNAGGTTESLVSIVSPGAVMTGRAAMVMTLLFALTALVGLILGLRLGLPVINQAVVAAAPGLAFLVQSYGGEALYRVVMFSQIGLAPLAGLALLALRGTKHNPTGPWAALPIPLMIMALFVPAHYGDERSLSVSWAEANASRQLYGELPSGAVIYPAINPTPVRSAGNYPEHLPGTGQYDPELLSINKELKSGKVPKPNDGTLAAIQAYMISSTPTGGCSYVLFTSNMERYTDTYGPHSRAQLNALKSLMLTSPDYTLVQDDSGGTVLRLHMKGQGGAPQLPGVVVDPQECS